METRASQCSGRERGSMQHKKHRCAAGWEMCCPPIWEGGSAWHRHRLAQQKGEEAGSEKVGKITKIQPSCRESTRAARAGD